MSYNAREHGIVQCIDIESLCVQVQKVILFNAVIDVAQSVPVKPLLTSHYFYPVI